MENVYRLTQAARAERFYALRSGIGVINLGPGEVEVKVNGPNIVATLKPNNGTCATGRFVDVALAAGQSDATVVCFPAPIIRVHSLDHNDAARRQVLVCRAVGTETWRIRNAGPDNLYVKHDGLDATLKKGEHDVFHGKSIDIEIRDPASLATAALEFLSD